MVGLAVLAAALRAWRIEAREPWLDEACSSILASGSLSDFAGIFAGESNPPLYLAVLFGWQKLAGTDPWALRLPTLLAGVALVPMVWWGARRFGASARVALLGAALAAASPLLLYYSLEARAYLFLWTFGFGAVLALDHLTSRPGSGRALAWAAVATVGALYTHYYGVFLLPLWALVGWAAPREHRRRLVLGFCLVVLAWLPWALAHLVGHVGHRGQAWLGLLVESPLAMLGQSAAVFGLVPPFPAYLGEVGSLSHLPGLGVVTGGWMAVPVLAGSAVIWRRGWTRAGLLLGAIVLPTVGALVVSLWRPIYLPGRYELMAYPAFLVLWAVGLQWLLGRVRDSMPAFAAAVALTAVTVGPLCAGWITADSGPPQHQDIAAILHDAPPEEPAVSVGLLWAPIELPLRNLDDTRTHLSHPREVAADHPGWFDAERRTVGELRAQATQTLADLGHPRHLWVVVPLAPGGAMAQPRLTGTLWSTLRQSGWQPEEPLVRGQLGVVRFSRR